MNGQDGHEELPPRPASYQPPIVIQERRNFWDVVVSFFRAIRTFFLGCLIFVLICFLTPFLIIFYPRIYESMKMYWNELLASPSGVGIPPEYIKFWLFCILLALAIGSVIRILRKI